MFFYWQEVLAVIEMLLVGHFSSKQGFCPSEFPVLENLRRVILESQGPDPGSVQAHLYQFVTIQQNRNFNISRLEPVACSCDPLSDSAPPSCSGASPSETML